MARSSSSREERLCLRHHRGIFEPFHADGRDVHAGEPAGPYPPHLGPDPPIRRPCTIRRRDPLRSAPARPRPARQLLPGRGGALWRRAIKGDGLIAGPARRGPVPVHLPLRPVALTCLGAPAVYRRPVTRSLLGTPICGRWASSRAADSPWGRTGIIPRKRRNIASRSGPSSSTRCLSPIANSPNSSTATGYVTVAERPLNPCRLSRCGAGDAGAGRAGLSQDAGPVNLRDMRNWWRWVPGPSWRRPEGPESSLANRADSSGRAGRL